MDKENLNLNFDIPGKSYLDFQDKKRQRILELSMELLRNKDPEEIAKKKMEELYRELDEEEKKLFGTETADDNRDNLR